MYIKPTVEFIEINTKDVILTSGGDMWDLPEMEIKNNSSVDVDTDKGVSETLDGFNTNPKFAE